MKLTKRPFFASTLGALALCLTIALAGRSQAGAPRLFYTLLLVGDQATAARSFVHPEDVVAGPTRVGEFTMIRLATTPERASSLARESGVYKVLPWVPPRLHDERSGQILAGAVETTGEVTGPGYLAWLQSKGLDQLPTIIVDITDDGFDKGSTSDVPPEFLDREGASRVVYARDFSQDHMAHDLSGHGTLNASILAAGVANSVDADGFDYALGVAPMARIGSSRIFNDRGDFDVFAFYSTITAPAVRDGVRVSSNSWGSPSNLYSADAIEYDQLVRDADPETPGDQPLVVVFSAGNGGPGGRIETPGTAKNVITVGAAEGVRSGTDGCRLGPTAADSALDIAFFSAGGPVDDGRIKPDIVAPGTHITGTLSRADGYTGVGVCGAFPGDRTRFTWSSGTSHAAPAVAGAAALLSAFLESTRGAAPSPALVKAWLLNTTRYMTGVGANDDLPSIRQGWGLLDLDRAFDDAPRVVVDQTDRLDTEGLTRDFVCVPADPTRPVRATLCWTDPPGTPSAAPLVNDLDLEVETNGGVYRGNHFVKDHSVQDGSADPRNTVESVWLPAGGGPLRVRVRATTIVGDGVPGVGGPRDQDYALVVYNAVLQPAPILKVSAATLDAPLDAGSTSSVMLTVTNTGTAAISAQSLTLTSSIPGVSVLDEAAQIPALAVGASAMIPAIRVSLAETFPCATSLALEARIGALAIPLDVSSGTLTEETLFEDDVEGPELWTVENTNSGARWFVTSAVAHGGSKSWSITDINLSGIGSLVSPPIQIPASAVRTSFTYFQVYDLERGFDGGIVEVSDGGPYADIGPLIRQGDYSGAVSAQLGNPLGTRNAWTGRVRTFVPVAVDLSPFAGRTIRLRLRLGTDTGRGADGWSVDDLRVSAFTPSCVSAGAAIPAITQASYKNGKLKLKGSNLSAQTTIEINGVGLDLPKTYRADKNLLRVKGDATALHLRPGAVNVIVLKDADRSSRPFGYIVK